MPCTMVKMHPAFDPTKPGNPTLIRPRKERSLRKQATLREFSRPPAATGAIAQRLCFKVAESAGCKLAYGNPATGAILSPTSAADMSSGRAGSRGRGAIGRRNQAPAQAAGVNGDRCPRATFSNGQGDLRSTIRSEAGRSTIKLSSDASMRTKTSTFSARQLPPMGT